MAEFEVCNPNEWVLEEDKIISLKLYKLRSILGVSREQLAEVTGISEKEIYNYEMGLKSIPASVLYFIAKTMDVPVSYFYNFSEEENVNWVVTTQEQTIDNCYYLN